MKILLVRHAEPDYSIDSLTPKGHREAAYLADMLSKVPIEAFYASPLGRARDTAAYTLEKAGRSAEVLPWLCEFRGRCTDPDTGKDHVCWDFRPRTWTAQPHIFDAEDWVKAPIYQGSGADNTWKETKQGVDELLARHGYRKDGPVWLCDHNDNRILVLFCHFGIAMAVLGYLTGMSPAVLWHRYCMQPSSVTTIVTEERIKGEVSFRCMGVGDLSHLNARRERYSTAALYPEVYDGRDTTNPIEWEKTDEN